MAVPKRSLRRRPQRDLAERIARVKRFVTCLDVLEHVDEYDVAAELKAVNKGSAGICPVGEHASKTCFRLYTETGSYCCFACKNAEVTGYAGDVIGLYAWMFNVNQSTATAELEELFDVEAQEGAKNNARESPTSDELEEAGGATPPVLRVSPVITQRLKNLDPHHESLAHFPIPGSVLERFGAGVDTGKGQMRGRLVCPVSNADGELVTHAAFDLEDSTWHFYTQYADFVGVDLYNFNRDSNTAIVLCSWPDDVWRHYVAGESPFLPVALFGAELSAEQEALLEGHVVVPLDL